MLQVLLINKIKFRGEAPEFYNIFLKFQREQEISTLVGGIPINEKGALAPLPL